MACHHGFLTLHNKHKHTQAGRSISQAKRSPHTATSDVLPLACCCCNCCCCYEQDAPWIDRQAPRRPSARSMEALAFSLSHCVLLFQSVSSPPPSLAPFSPSTSTDRQASSLPKKKRAPQQQQHHQQHQHQHQQALDYSCNDHCRSSTTSSSSTPSSFHPFSPSPRSFKPSFPPCSPPPLPSLPPLSPPYHVSLWRSSSSRRRRRRRGRERGRQQRRGRRSRSRRSDASGGRLLLSPSSRHPFLRLVPTNSRFQ
jgi:hypothetical protein